MRVLKFSGFLLLPGWTGKQVCNILHQAQGTIDLVLLSASNLATRCGFAALIKFNARNYEITNCSPPHN